jgi:hypothetical protein
LNTTPDNCAKALGKKATQQKIIKYIYLIIRVNNLYNMAAF